MVSAISLTRFQLSGTNSLFLSAILPLSALLNLPTPCGQCSFSYQVPVIWNQLPVSVHHSTSVSPFKSAYPAYSVDLYSCGDEAYTAATTPDLYPCGDQTYTAATTLAGHNFCPFLLVDSKVRSTIFGRPSDCSDLCSVVNIYIYCNTHIF